MTRFLAFFVSSLALVGTGSAAGTPDEPPYWATVSAIFAKRCINCHSQHGAAKGLRLDSYAATIAGGTEGAVLVPGVPSTSELILRLQGVSKPRMPFLGPPLPPEEMELILRWIEAGLPEIGSDSPPPLRPDRAAE